VNQGRGAGEPHRRPALGGRFCHADDPRRERFGPAVSVDDAGRSTVVWASGSRMIKVARGVP
jgi:hypothetical protein